MRPRMAMYLAAVCLMPVVSRLQADDLTWVSRKTEVRTGALLPRLTIPGDESDATVSGITVQLKDLQPARGLAKVIFDRTEYDFNEFGDPQAMGEIRAKEYAAGLRRIDIPDPTGEGRLLYLLRFVEDRFQHRFYLVLSPGPLTRDRLLIMAGEPPREIAAPGEGDRRPAPHDEFYVFRSILPLFAPADQRWLPVVPRGTALNLFSPRIQRSSMAPLEAISLSGDPTKVMRLTSDQNRVDYKPFGEVGNSTAVAYHGSAFRVEVSELADPLQRERTLIHLSPFPPTRPDEDDPPSAEDRPRYSLVISAEGNDSDRLLIQHGGVLTHVVPLTDYLRLQYLQERRSLEEAPAEFELAQTLKTRFGSEFGYGIYDQHIRSVTLSGQAVGRETIRLLASLPELKSLRFANYKGGELIEAAAELSGLPSLRGIVLEGEPVGDRFLDQLRPLAELTAVNLDHQLASRRKGAATVSVTDSGIRTLTTLSHLSFVRLYAPEVTDAGLLELSTLSGLQNVELTGTQVTVRGAVAFHRRAPSTALSIYYSRDTPRGETDSLLVELGVERNRIVLSGSLVTASDLAALGELRETVTKLCMPSSSLTDRDIAELSHLSKLEELLLRNNQTLTSAGVSHFVQFQKLQDLDLFHCEGIDDGAIESLSKLKGLRKLQVGQTSMTRAGVERLRASLPARRIEGP